MMNQAGRNYLEDEPKALSSFLLFFRKLVYFAKRDYFVCRKK